MKIMQWLLLLGVGLGLGELAANTKDVDLVPAGGTSGLQDKVAIVVGVEQYDRRLTGFRQLDYAADDAIKLTSVLQQSGYQVERLLNHQASKDIILNRIQQKAKRLPKGKGTLLFYFSGHGMNADDDNYLATYGSVAHKLSAGGLGIKEVVKTIREAGVKRAILFIDACRDGARPGVKSGEQGFRDVNVGEGVQLFFSTRHGDVSYEHDDLKHGVYSYYLIKALQGEAGRNGVITFHDLAGYVEREVADWTESHMSQTQQPYRRSAGDHYGDFVLVNRLSNGKQTATTLPITPEPAPQTVSVVTTPSPQPQAPAIVEVPIVTSPPAQRKSFEPELVSIPAGSFTMGCVTGRDEVEGGCYDDEKPPVTVQVSAFKLSKYEITVWQYMACVEAKVCPQPEWQEKDSKYNIHTGTSNRYKNMGSALTASNHPIVGVSWHNAKTYANWLSQQTGKRWRLPSEAEWEYAARGGDNDQAFPWGQKASHQYMNYGGTSGKDQWDYTAPVGSFAANGFGLHDMHGNVWEWVEDCWHGSHQGRPTIGIVWQDQQCGSYRVLRGGSWIDYGRYVRSAYRYHYSPVNRSSTGFRLARGH